MNVSIDTQSAPAAIGPYSQAIDTGDLVFVSGQLPIDPQTGLMPPAVGDQAKRSLHNVQAVLDAAGLQLADVIKSTVFVTDMNDFSVVNEEYSAFFGAPYPSRSCVEVARLPKGASVEVEVIARRTPNQAMGARRSSAHD